MPERYSELSVEELALMARKGDREARNTLYLRLQSEIARSIYAARRLAAKLTMGRSGPIEPEDVTQQAFVIFCALVNEWEPLRAPFVVYLTRMMRFRAFHYVRACLHTRTRTRQAAQNDPRCEEEQIDPGLISELVEGSELWFRLVACLDEDRKQIISLKFRKDLPTSRIARLTDHTPHNVNRYIQSALRLMRRNVVEEWEAL